MTLRDEERSLVARTVAALRRNGWPAQTAVAAIASDVTDARVRTQLTHAADALARGEKLETSDPFLVLLAKGEAGALEEEARAIDVAREARQVVWMGVLYPVVVLAAMGLIFLVFAQMSRVYGEMFRDFGSALPGPTTFVLGLSPAFPALALVCFAGAAVLVAIGRHGGRFVPGARALLAASRLRAYAAAVEGGSRVDDGGFEAIPLDAREAALGRRYREVLGEPAAAKRLASEMEVDARRAAAFARRWIPVVFLLAAFFLVGGFVIAMYLPIFTIANTLS